MLVPKQKLIIPCVFFTTKTNFFFRFGTDFANVQELCEHVYELKKVYKKIWDFLNHIHDIISLLMLQKIDLASILFNGYFSEFKIGIIIRH